MKICLKKVGNFFSPASKDQFDLMAMIPSDTEVIVDINLKRNAANHRRYFAFLNLAFEMQETFDNVDNLRHYLQMRAGHFETYVTHKGKAMYRARSIAWDKLGEDEFRPLFKQAVNAFLDFYNENHEKQLTEDEFTRIMDFL